MHIPSVDRENVRINKQKDRCVEKVKHNFFDNSVNQAPCIQLMFVAIEVSEVYLKDNQLHSSLARNVVTRRLTSLLYMLYMLLFLHSLIGCGGAGDSLSDETANLKGDLDIRGSISTQSGATLAGWVVVLVDMETELTKTASVSTSGVYAFKSVKSAGTYTVVLLSPTMRVSAVLFQPIQTTKEFYKQSFKINSEILPPLVVNGTSMNFQSESGITMTAQLVLDQLQDGIADGMSTSLALSQGAFNLSEIGSDDIDTDGIPNISDSDVDGDGIVNVFDPDDDGDQVLDVFDIDSDGDLVDDYILESSDQYFPEGVEWITVNYRRDVSTSKNTISFVAKVRSGVNPEAVQVLGPANLMNNALVEYIDAEGNAVSQVFDGRLLDEGLDGDSNAGDLIFGRAITLDSAAVLTSSTVVFIQLRFGSTVDPYFAEFPYLFSLGTPSNISISVTNDRTISMGTTAYSPFGVSQNYFLSFQVFNSEGNMIYSSNATEALPPTYPTPVTVPSGLSSDTSCTFQAVATSVDRIPGYSNYTVLSEKDPSLSGCP